MKSLPKSKMIVSLLLIGLAAIIVGGATMAWFTAEAEVADATFTAGTVVVNAEGPDGNYDLENRNLNVNPGDCGVITWNIINEGSKAARLRVNLNDVWSNVVGGEDTPDPFYFLQPDNSDWVMYDDGTDLWLYYKNDVPGTFNAADPANPNPKSSVELKLVYAFDGADMDNDYQSADLALGGSVNAIQASNDASLTDASWAAGWAAITGGAQLTGEALLNYNYFHEGAGKDSPCWKYHEKYNFTTQVGSYDGDEFYVDNSFGSLDPSSGVYPGGEVILVVNDANPNDNYWFWYWEVSVDGADYDILYTVGPEDNVGNKYTYNYIMPNGNVNLRAVFGEGHYLPAAH